MKSKQLTFPSNPRIRSFLSPVNKYGNRSFSTSQSSEIVYKQPRGSYIEFKKTTKGTDNLIKQSHNKVKIDQFQKKQNPNKDTKLVKCFLRNSQQIKNTEEIKAYETVRDLQIKVQKLQMENQILLEKLQKSLQKIEKQSEMIKNLQKAIQLSQSKGLTVTSSSYLKKSPSISMKHNYLSEQQWRYKQQILQAKICEHRLENIRISQKYDQMAMELQKMKFELIDAPLKNTLDENEERNWWSYLKGVDIEKWKEFQEIDLLLNYEMM